MIPNILHFVCGMHPDNVNIDFALSSYLAIKSAAGVNHPDAIFLHYEYEPCGEWWEKVKPLLTLNKVKAPNTFKGRPILHPAHKADVVRLESLYEQGGIYMDLDTISVRPLTVLRSFPFVIGQELNLPYVPKNARQKIKLAIRKKLGLAERVLHPQPSLCNAVLMAEKGSRFIELWMETYHTFRSKGKDKYWNEHSGKIPARLAIQYPELVKLVSPYAFHYPLYNEAGMKSMFEAVNEFPESYLHHLWESFSRDKYLSKLTPDYICTTDNTYNLIARKYL